MIVCTCVTPCSAGTFHVERHENQRLHDFLMVLDSDYYSRLRTQILSSDPLPSLDRAYQLVVQEERVRSIKTPNDDKPGVLGFVARASAGHGHGSMDRPTCPQCHKVGHPTCPHCHKVGHEASRGWSLLVCTHCKRSGHDIGQCYELVGYPDGSDSKGRGSRLPTGRARGSIKANAVVSASSSALASGVVGSSSSPTLFTLEQ